MSHQTACSVTQVKRVGITFSSSVPIAPLSGHGSRIAVISIFQPLGMIPFYSYNHCEAIETLSASVF
uniref:Uncharacterized protein n=1 Tax=Brassica oleracea var. oleracea TaxID=109376 RepID=A0A0D3BIV9_BRAOL